MEKIQLETNTVNMKKSKNLAGVPVGYAVKITQNSSLAMKMGIKRSVNG